MKTKRWQGFLWFAGLILIANGCATQALWSDSRFARFQEPAKPANLNIFQSPATSDFLVQYDERSEDSGPIHQRAYWLQQNPPSGSRHQPHFVSSGLALGLPLVPIFDSLTNVPPDVSLYVVLADNGQDFKLFTGEKLLGEYELPVYHKRSDRTAQVLLTPITVTAGATVVGTALAIVLAPFYWESLNCLLR